MKYKYAYVWNNQTAFFYANDMKTANAEFQKTYGFDPEALGSKVHITRSNA